MVEEVFRLLEERRSFRESHDLWECYGRLQFHSPLEPSVSGVKLIPDRGEVAVIVAPERDDETTLETVYREVFREKDPSRRKRAWLQHRRWFQDRTLNVLAERAARRLPPQWYDTGYRWVPYGDLDYYYDAETGFRWQDERERSRNA